MLAAAFPSARGPKAACWLTGLAKTISKESSPRIPPIPPGALLPNMYLIKDLLLIGRSMSAGKPLQEHSERELSESA